MGQTLQIGPLTLAWAFIILLAGWIAGTQLCERLARKQALKADLHTWLLAVLSLVAARLAFVVQYASSYSGNLTGIFDIRDGGWEPLAGLVVMAIYVLALWIAGSKTTRAVGAGAALFAAIWLVGNAAFTMLAPVQQTLPQFTGVALNAQPVALPELKGRPVVINLWASWCPPCRREMPVLVQAQADHPGVRFLWVNQGEAPEVVLRAAAQFSLPQADVLIDAEEHLSRAIRQRALPTTLFFNAEGEQVGIRAGELSKATITQHIAQITAPH